ncbi:hypothetical protein PHAVU_007G004000 [Phaseolus vulgaris]|uniref:Uncharacterized protein n=1 Tax=Phaseolus vulgaris TaxID=3885 RepID=V7B9S8_PHAVU|nr:hypothetical protein PHAVU_007G004000g [Phaseolus vulgaris]ESW14627.1 hypothetical protein PHAVU_007G004000g [Phaseolus vulgaris]
MFSVNTCTLPSQFPPPYPCRRLCRLTVVCSSFRRRSRSRRRHNKVSLPATTSTSSSFEPKFEAVIDLTPLTTLQSHLRRFILSGRDSYLDLETLLTLDHNRRLVVSCRPSTLHFLGTSAALTLLTFSVFSVLARLISRFSSWRRNASNNRPLVVRRDRSLGGKEVVVAWGQRSNSNPLSPAVRGSVKRSAKNMVRFERKLPEWWPTVVNANGSVFDANEQEEYKREAYRVVRAITNSRLGGNDINENDIIQLRQLCRTSGVQVSIEPTNIRDTLYRASVNFVLNVCSRAPTYSSSIDINGEDASRFLAGFAENIGLQNVRAATIVSAAIAARTRSCLLQAWALEMQGKQVEAMVELSKICLLLRIFPPEESSPEMEMVSRGLEKHLKLEQREHLMFLFGKVCGEHGHRIAREALGLTHSQNGFSDQLEDTTTLPEN